MRSQRIILGVGLFILIVISMGSISLDLKSRSDEAWVKHTLEVLNQLSELRVLIRGVEASARGYMLTSDRYFLDDFRQSLGRVVPGLSSLQAAVADNAVQLSLLAESEPVIERRLAVLQEGVRARDVGDAPGMTALIERGEGRGAMLTLNTNFDRVGEHEKQLLEARSVASRRSGNILLATDLSGTLLILLIAGILTRESRRSSAALKISLQERETANATLETLVAERTEGLRKAHDELSHSNSVLESTFASMAEAVLVIDDKSTVVVANVAARRLLGYRAGMALGHLPSNVALYLVDGTTLLAAADMPSARVLRGEQFDALEIVSHVSDRRDPLHYLISGRPIQNASGETKGAALVYHDVTAARETERKLQQSQKLDAIGKLTGGIAHDFNNMLTVVVGASEILTEGLERQPDLLIAAKLIAQASDRCSELVQHLLAFARKQPLQPRDVDINAAVLDTAKLIRPALGEHIEIETSLEAGIPAAHIDPSQLANSLLNMAINSRDAMPSGGKLLLETKAVILDDAYALENSDVLAGRYVMVAVSDTGTGIPPDVRAKVFEPFFTTKAVGKGTGLGLSMVYGFVKQSGGHIKIYSEEGHGTTIKLYLPPADGLPEITASEFVSIAGGSETVLIVEDDVLVRDFVVRKLRSLGYTTVALPDSSAALSYVDARKPFDLLFTDVVLPGGMSGRHLADAIESRRPGTRVLYTSGYTENSIVHHGRLDKGVLLLPKPYRKSQLAQMVRQALDSSVT
jgi:PAS domain S-box-containing protein